MANNPTNTAEENLLQAVSTNADRRAFIRAWLNEIGIKDTTIRAEFKTKGGIIDLYLTNKRIIIEIKNSKKLKNGPHEKGTGSRNNKSAFEQLESYVKSEREREQQYLDDDDKSLKWIGIITDAKRWWIWEWSPEINVFDDCKKITEWQKTLLTRANIKQLRDSFFVRKVGKEWATSNISDIFDNVINELKEMWKTIPKDRDLNIQKKLWRSQLESGGNFPSNNIDEIFMKHTVLIIISRLISNNESIDGFIRWVPDEIKQNLKTIINKYNWKQETGDILRSIYQHLIPKEHRKLYGEHYTPDWLAEKICKDIIDEDFITSQIKNYNLKKEIKGILDPSCGSGTFIYQSIKHVLESESIKKSQMDNSELVDFISKLVYGIDIHPVAVEMSKANVKRILPNILLENINIYQADSLMIKQSETKLQSIGVRSNHKYESLLKNHKLLCEIIEKEGNNIWFILNQIGPMKLKNKMGIIISNPPWLKFSEINIPKRKEDMINLADSLEIRVKERNPVMNISMLFVLRCRNLYLNDGKSAWVLPMIAMSNSTVWKKFNEKHKNNIKGKYNLGNIAFPDQGSSCVLFFDVDVKDKKLENKLNNKIYHNETWNEVIGKTTFKTVDAKKNIIKSLWVDNKNIKGGATLSPYAITRISDIKRIDEKNVKVTLAKSKKGNWKYLDILSGVVPEYWIYDCIYSDNLLPFYISGKNKCLLPILNNGWDASHIKNNFYKKIIKTYEDTKKFGSVKTIWENFNFQGQLFLQFKNKKPLVIYNKSGSIMRAAVLPNNGILVDKTLYTVKCDSKNEAIFLTGILNAKSLFDKFNEAKATDRDFVAYFWEEIDIPRYDKDNVYHNKLIDLSNESKMLSKKCFDPNLTSQKMRNIIHEKLSESKLMTKIDEIVAKIIDDDS